MATEKELGDLKKRLIDKQMSVGDAEKAIAYIMGELRTEAAKERGKPTPVTNNSIDQLYSLIVKFRNLGLVIDGVNVVITGRNMAMATYHGYKNKVLQTYPDSSFDVQLVREGDTFSIAKESGNVIYTHNFGDPFGNTTIKGAYAVIKNSRGEYLELLNKTDFEQMRQQSKQKELWNKWLSEFWFKSVMKRACKKHFNDVIADLDKVDNDDYGAANSPGEVDASTIMGDIKKAADAAAVHAIVGSLNHEQQKQVAEAATVRLKELAEDAGNV